MGGTCGDERVEPGAAPASSGRTADPLPDLCPGDGRPHWDHEPAVRVRHLGIGDDATSVELVAGCCPACGQVLVNLELETTDAGDPVHDEACWVSLDDILRGTRGFLTPSKW